MFAFNFIVANLSTKNNLCRIQHFCNRIKARFVLFRCFKDSNAYTQDLGRVRNMFMIKSKPKK